MSDQLFEPFCLKSLDLPNRIVMAPMTRSFSPGGVPGQDVAEYYARRATGGVGLIVTEGTTIDRLAASFDEKVPNFHEPDSLAGWANVAQTVHQAGGKIAPQIWHTGMMRKPGTGPHPDAVSDSPSGRTHKGKQVLEAPTSAEVDDMVMAFAKAAGEARRLGFDCVEIHGAHGYLIDQFFWDRMNVRDDRFGGTLPERATFAADIIRETRKAVGDDFPIILRFSQWKQQDYAARLADTPEDLGEFLNVFVDAGVDILHCSQRRYWEAEFPDVDGENGLNCAGWAKKLTGVPTITVGSVGLSSDFFGAFMGQNSERRALDDLDERLSKGEFDLVAVGRALLHDPDWAAKVRDGRQAELEDYDGASLLKLT